VAVEAAVEAAAAEGEGSVAPIEVVFGMIVFMFGLVGLVRGFLRELGVTLAMVLLLFFLSRFEPQLDQGMVRLAALGSRILPERELLPFLVLLFVIVGVAFVSYQGETLAYRGQGLRGAPGALLGALVGLVNGYLIGGSIWYYMDKFHYPLTFLGFSSFGLSSFAQGMLRFLPNEYLGQPALLGQSLLLYLAIILFVARIIR
jgi:uncharacterized membrane protein required for colicin V production